MVGSLVAIISCGHKSVSSLGLQSAAHPYYDVQGISGVIFILLWTFIYFIWGGGRLLREEKERLSPPNHSLYSPSYFFLFDL